MNITSGLLGTIQPGAAGVIIGAAADTGDMNVGNFAWNAPLELDSGSGNVNITNGAGSLDFSGHGLTVNTVRAM